MSNRLDLEGLLKDNPHIDIAKLKEGLGLSEELRQAGVKGKGYHLVSPGGHRKAAVTDSKGQRHAVQLRAR